VLIEAPVERVRAAVANGLIDRGFTITRSEDLVIEGRRDAGMAASVFFATPRDPSANVIARVNLVDGPEGVRVVVRTFLVAGGRDQGESGSARTAQAWLAQVKATAESGR
jgi:hypothetical protein